MSSSTPLLLGVSILSLLAATPACAQAVASTSTTSTTQAAGATVQTATVERSQVKFVAVYTGAPQFQPIAGTTLVYATNSATPIIRVGSTYYALQNGIWFTAASPTGPWVVAVTVPSAIYAIPSSSSLHYVTYAYVYGSSGTQVYVGYAPAYYTAVAASGGVVAGSVYGSWGSAVAVGRGAAWADPYSGNYGRAGEGAFYNEATGARGYGYAGRNTNAYTGETRAAAGGAAYNPTTGRAVAGEAVAAGNIYTGEAGVAGHSASVNTNTGQASRQAGAAGRNSEGAGAAGAFETNGAKGSASGAGYATYDRDTGQVSRGGVVDVNGDVYAAKDGQAYKKTDSGWEEVSRSRTQRSGSAAATRERPTGSFQRSSGSRPTGGFTGRSGGGGARRR